MKKCLKMKQTNKNQPLKSFIIKFLKKYLHFKKCMILYVRKKFYGFFTV